MLRNEPKRIEEQIEFPERLRTRQIEVVETPEPVRTDREPVLPEPTGPAATEATVAKPKPTPVATTPDKLSFFVQAGAFADNDSAVGLVAELGELDITAQVREVPGESGNKLFRVLVGPFDRAAAAEGVRANLALVGRSSTTLQLPEN